MEIERKFLVRESPGDLASHPSERIEQGYLALDADRAEVRVRRRAGRATLTVKQGTGLVRLEEEISIGRARFARLWPLTEGRRVEKTRHLVPVDGATVEVDVYAGSLAGLIVAEVEFASVEDSLAFRPPGWMGDEVTGDPRYANRTLATKGRPDGAFRLGEDESVAEGVPRIARGQLDKAIAVLGTAGEDDLGEAIHTTRKALKRLRTTLRLSRDELGDEIYDRENAAFRDSGRCLSGARDSQVVLETFDGLADGRFGDLREALAAEHEEAQRRMRSDEAAVRGVLDTLTAARGRTSSWPLDDDDPRALADGYERIYRRGRKALAAARADPGDETLHELRKRVKDLWYASQIIQPASKKAKKVASQASDLSDVIGNEHDLAVLRETADRHRHTLTADEFAQLDELIGERREALQRRALKDARQLYRRKPKAALSRVGLA